MKKEQAFEAMKNGAIISHITWEARSFIREVDGKIGDERGIPQAADGFPQQIYANGWFIVRKDGYNSSYQAEQLLKAIPLHLEDPNRVWCYSGHEAEPVIAKEIRNIHEKVERLKKENEELKDQVESLKSAVMVKDETIGILRERMNHF